MIQPINSLTFSGNTLITPPMKVTVLKFKNATVKLNHRKFIHSL